MITKLIAWVISVLILFQDFALCTPAQAATLATPPIALTQASRSENEKVLTFSDTDTFYSKLADALKSKSRINIETPFTSYDEFPPRLKEVFELHQPKHSLNIPRIVAAPNPSFNAAYYALASIHYGALISAIASASIGAGIGGGVGTFVGGVGAVPGALVGAGFGLSTWAVSQAVINNCHKVVIQISVSGSLIISIEPVCPFIP